VDSSVARANRVLREHRESAFPRALDLPVQQAQPMTNEPMSLGRHSNLARSTGFVPDSPLEEDGFEPSVPEKEPVSVAEGELRRTNGTSPKKVVSSIGIPKVRIHLPPAESQPRTMDARRDQHLDADPLGGQLALPRPIRLMSATVWRALRRDRDHRAVVGAGYRDCAPPRPAQAGESIYPDLRQRWE
jgi:hypothetical protein